VSTTKIIFGLGNPGKKYFFTRHNIGYRVVDAIAQKLEIPLKKKISLSSMCGQGRFNNRPFILAKPLTFMNESGKALKLLAKKFSPDFKNLLVIYDDIDLPLGTIRFRTKGGPGTHKGMKSCIEFLGNSDFPRLRLGIKGDRGERDLSEYVLEDFTKEEEEVLKEVLDAAVDEVFIFLKS
jgi:PTH1 family peptidyl-tRNA hydrolase